MAVPPDADAPPPTAPPIALPWRPEDWNHKTEGGFFSGGEASWGVADGWSLYGGALADKHYQSAAMGVGRDLAQFGALAFDVTHSHVNLDHDSAYGTLAAIHNP